MILVFNALNVRPAVYDGAATFGLNLLSRLPAALPEARIVALVQPGETRVPPAENLELREIPGTATAGRRVGLETFRLSRELRSLAANVLLAPYESIPLAPPCPVVCVAQNLVYHRGDFFSSYLGSTTAERALSRVQAAYYRRRMRSAYRRAWAVVGVSAETVRVLSQHAGLDPRKSTVVHEGSDSDFLPPPRDGAERSQRLLSVGTFTPYKNHERVIDLFAALAPQHPELTLELIGGNWRGYRSIVERHAASTGLADRIRLGSGLPPAGLAERYESSALLLHLSSCESFGLPMLEAMRYGLPVVAANRSSLPEVAGGAALLVEPDALDAAADAIDGLLRDGARLDELSRRGRARAAELTWSRTAAGIADVLRRAAGAAGYPRWRDRENPRRAS